MQEGPARTLDEIELTIDLVDRQIDERVLVQRAESDAEPRGVLTHLARARHAVGVDMCAPRSGNQKGAVERLVGWVKGSFFKHRKFQDEADLQSQLAAWHIEANTKTASRATGVIPETRRQEELARLRPIKVFPERLALRVPIFVGPTAEVLFEGAPYSMPPEATHIAGTLFLCEDRLHIIAGRFEARHRRCSKDDPPSPLPEHRAAKIAAVHGKRAKLYEKRQQVLNLGPDALALLTEITHHEPKLSSRRVEDLYQLLEAHGDNAMREAIGRAVRSAALSVAGVRRALRTLSARRLEGSRPRAAAAPPRGPDPHQLTLPVGRAESKRGAYTRRERLIDRDLASAVDRPKSCALATLPRSIGRQEVARFLASEPLTHHAQIPYFYALGPNAVGTGKHPRGRKRRERCLTSKYAPTASSVIATSRRNPTRLESARTSARGAPTVPTESS